MFERATDKPPYSIPRRDKASSSHCISRDLAPAIISHTFQSLEHDDGIASYDNHAQPLAFTTGFLFDGVIEDNVEENLEMQKMAADQ